MILLKLHTTREQYTKGIQNILYLHFQFLYIQTHLEISEVGKKKVIKKIYSIRIDLSMTLSMSLTKC